ncbi:MAG: M3 family metallopeptidase [Patescibacteria group bacterium]
MEKTNVNDRKSGAEEVRWDLSVFYSGLDDPGRKIDLERYEVLAREFKTKYRGNLSSKLGEAIADYKTLDVLGNKILVYLSLLQSTDTGDARVNVEMDGATRRISLANGECLTFFELELVGIPVEVLEELYKSDEVVAKHRPWIEHARIFRPHLLSEEVESALEKRSPFASSSWGDFFDELEADLLFDFGDKKMTLVEMLNVLDTSYDPVERRDAIRVLSSGLGGPFAKYSARTLSVVSGARALEKNERGYKNPMEPKNMENRVPTEVVDALHRAVEETAVLLAKRWYRLKAAHLGQGTLRWSDRNAPLPFSRAGMIPFDEATKTVVSAYERFSPTLAEIIQKMFSEKRIDAPAGGRGRAGGAYNCSLILSDGSAASFTFLNYLGSERDVMTLAHELGHGVHGVLAGEHQGALMQHAPIVYAETASVFGEMITFNFLREKLLAEGKKEELLGLVSGKLTDALNTMVRQIGFSRFEQRIHGMDAGLKNWEEPRRLSVDELNRIFRDVLCRFYGEEGEVFTYENVENLWAYVSHFHRPFYVYGYAFGEILTQSLYAEQERLGDRFEPLYLDLLRAGSSKGVIELLAPFGIDPRDQSFWTRGIEVGLGRMVKDAEELSRDMGVSL